jgi:membrane protease YdiL (CAAX protease family)
MENSPQNSSQESQDPQQPYQPQPYQQPDAYWSQPGQPPYPPQPQFYQQPQPYAYQPQQWQQPQPYQSYQQPYQPQPQPYQPYQPYQPQPLPYQPYQPYQQPQPWCPPYSPQSQPYQQPQPYAYQQPYQPYQPQQWQQPQPYQPYQQPYQPQFYQQIYAPAQPSPVAIHKQRIRSTVMKIALALTGFYVVNVSVITITLVAYLMMSDILGSLTSTLSSMNTSPQAAAEAFLGDLPLGLMSILGIIAGAFMLLIVRGIRPLAKDLVKVNECVCVPDLCKMMGLILGFGAVISIIPLLFETLLQAAGVSFPSETTEDLFTSFLNFPGILYVVILGPFFEEIIFRGAILRSLQPYGENFAIVLSSLLFGVYHLVFLQGIFAFFVGLILAYCTLRFSIKWSMLLHMLNNGISMTILWFSPTIAIEMSIYLLFLVLAIIAGIFGFKQFRLQLRVGKPTSVSVSSGIPFATQPDPLGAYRPAGAYYNSTGVSVPVAAVRPRPYAIAFTSAWLITGLSVASLLTLLTTFIL